MTDLVVLCADGSELSTRALAAGLALLGPDVVPVVATVVEPLDQMLVSGTGMAGGTMSPETFEREDQAQVAEGERVVREVAAALGAPEAETVVLRGDAGLALCGLAEERDAAAMVIGTRGRGGFKRALLGSVSDVVVRNAPCPVIVSGASEE
jgi:nucleotide-binding universal stress UspA family protein